MRRVEKAKFLKASVIAFIFTALIYYLKPAKLSVNDKVIVYQSYENETFTKVRKKVVGPGEHGVGVVLSEDEQKKIKPYHNQNGYNIYVSDLIALDRSLPDTRHPKCKTMLYPAKLPSVSIIITFHEEHLSTLLRTVLSSLKRSPPGVVKEVILVDDASIRRYLKEDLDEYIQKLFPKGVVKVIRLQQNEGLMRARMHGAKVATGDVLVILDSHTEANDNWLPPLLDPIAQNYKTVTLPLIDNIDSTTLQYYATNQGQRGAFDWILVNKRLPRLPKDEKHPELPFDSPIMAGGLFAISRKWFWELGGYDPGLLIWGYEQFEISFKIWMCGGSMKEVPCSRIGHIWRKFRTNFPPHRFNFNPYERNMKRVAEAWMDEYKEYVYIHMPNLRIIDVGNMTAPFDLRKKLKCKTFKWYMTEIAFDVPEKYSLTDPDPTAVGDVRPNGFNLWCIDGRRANESITVRLEKCTRTSDSSNTMQSLVLTFREDIRIAETMFRIKCLDVPKPGPNGDVVVYNCHEGKGNQQWSIEPIHKDKQNPIRIRHSSGNCMDSDIGSGRVLVNPCNSDSKSQAWNWEKLQLANKP